MDVIRFRLLFCCAEAADPRLHQTVFCAFLGFCSLLPLNTEINLNKFSAPAPAVREHVKTKHRKSFSEQLLVSFY